jgi:phosphoribosyl-ATP pyrophosphohydrolase
MRRAEVDSSGHTGSAITRLWAALEKHIKHKALVPPRTARLVRAGRPKMAEKLVEEAGEVAIAVMLKDRVEIIRESADVLYHLTVLWAAFKIAPEQIWAEMNQREVKYGLAEKRAKRRRKRM